MSHQSLSHSKWDCKYHLVFVPDTGGRKVLYGKIRAFLGPVFHELAGQKPIALARQFSGRKRNFNGEALWTRGYAVSTVVFPRI